MDKNLEIFCVTDKHFNFFNDIKYKLAGVGKNNFPSNYITCNTGENIFLERWTGVFPKGRSFLSRYFFRNHFTSNML